MKYLPAIEELEILSVELVDEYRLLQEHKPNLAGVKVLHLRKKITELRHLINEDERINKIHARKQNFISTD